MKTLWATEMMRLKPGTIVMCRCGVYYRIQGTYPKTTEVGIMELGLGDSALKNKASAGIVIRKYAMAVCLPVSVVDWCVFGVMM